MTQQDEAQPRFAEYAALFRRCRAWIFTIVPACILLSVFVAYTLTPQYRSTATIILEPSAIEKELIATSVASYADQQIEIISGRVMALPTLEQLVREYDPYPDAKDMNLTQKAKRVLDDVDLERVDPVTLLPLDKSPAFSLHYQNPDPHRAAVVATRLAELFLSYHQRERLATAKSAEKLIATRADLINKQLLQLDDEYSELVRKYGNSVPDSKGRNQDSRDRAQRDLEEIERQLRNTQQQESLFRIQLNGLSPFLMASKGDLTNLATVKAQLADAQQRYTPDHPDVKRLKRALAALMTQGATDRQAPISTADNPDYLRVANDLEAAHHEVAALEANAARVREQVAQYSGLMRSSPDAERAFADLDRRRDSVKTQFNETQEKLKNAEVGQIYESEQHGEHFSMIREPFAATSPNFPNRLGMILLGIVLGCALAAIAVAIKETADATVRGADDLKDVGISLLGGIPEILRPADQRQRRLLWGSVSAAYIVFAVLTATVIIRSEVRTEELQHAPASSSR
jgi:polysaccharide biosynthesis transport protein